MPNGNVSEGLAGLRTWSEPIIFDRLLDGYRQQLGAGASAWSLARLHARAWKAAILGDKEGFDAARWALLNALNEHLLNSDDVARADAEIIVELLDIVMARFQRSASTARSYHLALIALAGRLSPQPTAAAA
jgi:hypothetical protein